MNNAARSPQLQEFDEALLADGGFVPRSEGYAPQPSNPRKPEISAGIV
jgi:hypothetical protein